MRQRKYTHDVIVVGARVAGASTAMLLARQGLRVLLVDRHRYGADTLSTHALMRGGVFLLSRWGLLDRIVATGTPPIRQARFDYGTDAVTVAVKPTPGVPALYAPRRTVLDPLLIDAAAAAGADVRFGVSVEGLIRDGSGQVVGIHARDRTGTAVTARAPLTVGADGVRSAVARGAGAATLRAGTGAGAVIYGHWSDLDVDGYEWFYRLGGTAGLIPTNGGQVCAFAPAAPAAGWPEPVRRPGYTPGSAGPACCGGRTDRAGRWSATRGRSSTRSAPTESRTRCAMRSCWQGQWPAPVGR